jgi:hypothetical protein
MKNRIYPVLLGALISILIIAGITKRAIDIINYLTL